MIPASIRNNNPGAMYPGPSARKFGSTSFETLKSKDGTHKIATFPSHKHGAAAMFDLLARDYTGKTIEAAITRWCGGYYASTYLKVLEQKGGIKATDVLTRAMLLDHVTAVPIARAMAWQEAGQDYPLSEQEWVAAHSMAFSEAVAPVWSPTNDVPTPKPETRQEAAAQSVANIAGPALATGGTAATWFQLPAPPDLSGLTAWQGAVTQGKDLALWGVQAWPWVLGGVAAYWLLGHAIPSLIRR